MSDVRIDTALVRKLIAGQFPTWTHLAVRPVANSGWDNRTFHLGDTMSIRLPSAQRYAAQVAKEQHWLPQLAPHLPLPISNPVAQGQPALGYPFSWSIMAWQAGHPLSHEPNAVQQSVAQDLATFLKAFHTINADTGPAPGMHNFYRGGDLRIYDQEVRHCLTQLETEVDGPAILGLWTKACARAWTKPPVWVHGDIAAGNLLCQNGKLSAVIDFGNCGTGDPACDLTIAWTVFAPDARQIFKDSLGLDQATWERAAGWCLWKALLQACTLKAEGFDTLAALIGSDDAR